MIIYYHCTRDSALLPLFLLTCHPYIPFHFVPPIFFRADARSVIHAIAEMDLATHATGHGRGAGCARTCEPVSNNVVSFKAFVDSQIFCI